MIGRGMQKPPPAQIAHGELLEVSVTGGQLPAAEVEAAAPPRLGLRLDAVDVD